MAPETSARGDPDRARSAVDVYLSAGSNVAPEKNLSLACRALAHRFGPLRLSGVYRTPPVGFAGDDFLNLVVHFRTAEPPSVIVDRGRPRFWTAWLNPCTRSSVCSDRYHCR